MTQKPSVPDTELLPLFDKMHEISQKILGAIHLGDMPQINALLQARASLLETLGQTDLGHCPELLREQLQSVLQKIQTLEPEIIHQLEKLRQELEEQLHLIQDAKTALSPYKLQVGEQESTRSTQA